MKDSKKKSQSKSSKKKSPKNKPLQPELNIGLFGHVDHGKTTLVKALSGHWTDTHSEELKRGITIRLGYADTVIREYKEGKTTKYTTQEAGPGGEKAKVVRAISFVDAPGHESLMATMLSGATIIDAAMLLVAANEECPQPQTREHLMALDIMGIKNLIVIQNKIDLVPKDAIIENYNAIKTFLKDTPFKGAPIIPISAQQQINIDLLLEFIQDKFKSPKRNSNLDPLMLVARSFDINKPGADPTALMGGILGGTLIQGKLKVGDDIEIRPGFMSEEKNKRVWTPIKTKITGLKTGNADVDQVTPGGSIGLMTQLDPAIVKSDMLTGSSVGHAGKLPPVHHSVKLETHLLERVVGSKEDQMVEPVKVNEALMMNANAASTVGVVTKAHQKHVEATLKIPICGAFGSRITISRRIGNRFRLIGYGILKE